MPAKPILIAALAATSVAVLGALSTELGPWYRGLRKPSWQPPDWLFGPVWTFIFAAAALAAILYWRSDASVPQRERMLAAFAGNAFLNVLWSLLFFRLKRPDWALIEVVLLWLSIVLMMFSVADKSRASLILLVPYLCWVGFAAYLNLTIVRLNGY